MQPLAAMQYNREYRHWDSVQCSSDEITVYLQNGSDCVFFAIIEPARDQNELPYYTERQKSADTIYIRYFSIVTITLFAYVYHSLVSLSMMVIDQKI